MEAIDLFGNDNIKDYNDNIVDYIWKHILNKLKKPLQRYYFKADGNRKDENGKKLRRATHYENIKRTIKKKLNLQSASGDEDSDLLPYNYYDQKK